MKNYTLFSKDREEVKGGGVAIYTRNDVRAYEVKEKSLFNTKSEQVWCNIKTGKENLLVSTSYRPPVSSRAITNDILNNILKAKKLVDDRKYTGIICMGDFNYEDVEWDNDGGVCRGRGKKASLEMLEKIGSGFLIQHVFEPTFGNNTLDLIFTESPNRISNVKIGPPFNSSEKNKLHSSMSWVYNLGSKDVVKFNSDKFVYKRGDFMGLYLEKVDWELEGLDANKMY